MPKPVFIIGAGGVGREIAAVLSYEAFAGYKVMGFIDDGQPQGAIVNRLRVAGGIDWLLENAKDAGVILAIGNPQVRRKIIDRLAAANFFYPVIVHPNASIHDKDRVAIGQGCYIGDGCILTTDIVISDFCFINSACSFQHDTQLGKNCVIMPGVRITGGAKVEDNCYIAANCVIATAIIIENASVIKTSIL
jgi:sugar O-acyltransferase (sialic acid O-acetyltransferase NeuD family)